MNESFLISAGMDVLAIACLAYGIYFRRHRRRDLMLAFVALNVGVLVVTSALMTVEAGIGLGFGLFGILSIVRLRSDQVAQQEIGYYFISLALGLLGGLHPGELWAVALYMGALVVAMYIADHPRLAGDVQRQVLTLDHAYPDRAELEAALERLLHATVLRAISMETDLVRDTTMVDVRYRLTPNCAERHLEEPVIEAPIVEPHVGEPLGAALG